MQTPVHCSPMVMAVTEVLPLRLLLIVCNMHGMIDQFVDSLIFRGRDRNDRDTELIFHLIYINISAVRMNLIHHIQRNNGRYTALKKLHRKVKIALDIRRIDDIDDPLRLFLQDEISGDKLFTRIRRHGIDARKVCYTGI